MDAAHEGPRERCHDPILPLAEQQCRRTTREALRTSGPQSEISTVHASSLSQESGTALSGLGWDLCAWQSEVGQPCYLAPTPCRLPSATNDDRAAKRCGILFRWLLALTSSLQDLVGEGFVEDHSLLPSSLAALTPVSSSEVCCNSWTTGRCGVGKYDVFDS